MAFLGFRRIDKELEARLSSQDGGASGKAERKWYADGGQRLKVRLAGLALLDGSEVAIKIGGRLAATAPVKNGRLKIDLESLRDPPPSAADGEVITVEYVGEVVASGELYED